VGQKNYKNLILKEKQNILRIILNRPDVMNALNAEMYIELHSILDMVERNPECRVLIITGSGKAFCAGVIPVSWSSKTVKSRLNT